MEDHGELPIEDFTHVLLKSVLAIKMLLIWVCLGLGVIIGILLQ